MSSLRVGLLVFLAYANVAQAGNEVPPPELLEFVGIWQDAEGAWFDPSQLEGWQPGRGDEADEDESDDKGA